MSRGRREKLAAKKIEMGASDARDGRSRSPVVVVTGGSSGIGLATAKQFAGAEWRVVIGGRSALRLDEAADSIIKALTNDQSSGDVNGVVSGSEVIGDVNDSDENRTAVTCEKLDVRARESVELLVGKVSRQFGRIDAWVNAAGIAPMGPVTQLSDHDLENTFRTNCASIFYATRALWPVFQSQRCGVIVNVSSLASTDPFPGFSVYGASKAWVNLFSQATANEGQDDDIRVYSVCPGAVETPLLRELFPDFPADQAMPPKRVADVIWSLCQADCQTPSGTSLEVHPNETLTGTSGG